jgi:hypothetical protein
MIEGSLPTPSRCPRLPPELVDGIVDHLHADRFALARCALVCKSWVTASRYHRFHTSIEIHKDNISVAIELLSSSTCTFANAIVHLRLFKAEALRDLHEITFRLPRVTQLTLRATHISDTKFPGEALAPLLPNLHHLRFGGVRIETSVIPWFLENCPRLRHLSAIQTTVFDDNVKVPIRPHALTPALKSLSVCDADSFSKSLVTHWNGVFPEPATLKFRFPAQMGGILMAIGSSLQTLQLHGVDRRLCE